MAKEKKNSGRGLLSLVIPACVAVAVVVGLAVSGKVTADRDKVNPTVITFHELFNIKFTC